MTTITEEEKEKRIMEEFEREQKAKAEEIKRLKKKKNFFADITFMPSWSGGGGGCG
jgi:hypothetical protein